MDFLFKMIALIKNIFVKKEIISINGIDWENVIIKKVYTVKITTDINSLDHEIIARYYEVVGLTNRRCIRSLYEREEKANITTICESIRDAIELDANVKIDPNKLFKAVKICYSGSIVIDNISIKFVQN